MSVPWNPSAPAIQGFEWNAGCDGAEALGSTISCVAQRLRSTVTESIDVIKAFGFASGANQPVLMEVFTAGAEVATNVVSTNYVPNSNVNASPGMSSVTCGTNYHLCLAGTSGSILPRDEEGLELTWPTNAVAGRISSVAFTFRAQNDGTLEVQLVRVSDGFAKPLGEFQATPLTPPGYPGADISVLLGEVNPFTDQPWTLAEVRGFDTVAPLYRIKMVAHTSVYQIWTLARMTVTTCDENRLARSLVMQGGPSLNWFSWPATKPDGTANWSKVNGTKYTIVFRHPIGGVVTSGAPSQFGVGWTDSKVTPPYGESAFAPTIAVAFGGVSVNIGVISAMGVAQTRGYSVVPTIAGSGVVSVDGMSYRGIVASPVSIFHSASIQEITVTGGPVTINAAAVLCRPTGVDPPPGQPMSVALTNNTGGTTHASGSVTLADWQRALDLACSKLNANGVPWKRVVVPLSPPFALVNATQYRVQASSFAVTGAPSNSWEVSYMLIDPLSTGVFASYNGNTDGGFINGAKANIDYQVQLLQQAPTVTGAAADAQMDPAGGPNPSFPTDTFTICGGAPGSLGVPYIRVTWAPTSLGANFGHYEVQRQETGGDWVVIARLSNRDFQGVRQEGNTEIHDYDAPLNEPVSYRVRVVGLNGTVGDWSAAVTATQVVESSGEGSWGFYTFTSNLDPTLNLLYLDVYDGPEARRRYEVLDAAQTAYDAEYQRDYWVEQRSTELRGVRFSRPLLVNAIAVPSAGKRGLDRFAALRRLQTVTYSPAQAIDPLGQRVIPYVTVRNESGDRFYASVLVPDVEVRQPSNLYFATVTVTELTGTPTPMESAL